MSFYGYSGAPAVWNQSSAMNGSFSSYQQNPYGSQYRVLSSPSPNPGYYVAEPTNYSAVSVAATPPPPPVQREEAPSIDLTTEALTGSVVKKQKQARAAELSARVAEVDAALRHLVDEDGETVDGACDTDPIRLRVDFHLNEGEEQIPEGLGETVNLSMLKAVMDDIQTLEEDAHAHAAGPIVHKLLTRVEDGVALLKGTRNRAAADEFARIAEALLDSLRRFSQLQVENDESLHSEVFEADAACANFEMQRDEVDWSKEMIAAEKTLYKRVSQVMKRAARASRTFEIAVEQLTKVQEAKVVHNMAELAAGAEKTVERTETERKSLQDKEHREIASYGRLRATLDKSAAAEEKRRQELTHERNTLVDQIRTMLQRVEKVQGEIWTCNKAQRVYQTASGILEEEHNLNRDLQRSQTTLLTHRLTDAKAMQETARLAEETVDEITESLATTTQEMHSSLRTCLYDVVADRLVLVARKYHKTCMAIYAAQARIAIKTQEAESVKVRKQRRNLAQDIEGVEQCNRAFEEIRQAVTQATEDISRLTAKKDDLRHERDTAFLHLTSLPVPEGRADVAARLEHEWRESLGKLEALESRQREQIALNDVLDASFL